MSRQLRTLMSCVVTSLAILSGCCPSQPFYLCESGDLPHYLETATQIEYPDVTAPSLDEVNYAQDPYTLSDPFESGNFWDLTLEDAVSTALHNSKLIRNLDSVIGGLSDLLRQPQASPTVYDPAIIESDPFAGVEGALAEFDAQLSTSLFWNEFDRPQNLRVNTFGFSRVLQQDTAAFGAELSKKAATGTQLFFRHTTDYERGNRFGGVIPPSNQALGSFWTTGFEVEVLQPLLRGNGTQINRIPVIIARINNDISLADFEAHVRNLVMDVERTYWDLLCTYRVLDANKRARDQALATWRDVEAELRASQQGLPGSVGLQAGSRTAEDELRARGQYYAFRAQVETNLPELYNAENRLRWLMGLAATDGRLLRPIDEPTKSKIVFDWNEIHCEALVRTVELRRQKWVIKQREMELIAARNRLLPELNATALYRWLGVGDNLVSSDRNGLDFPQPSSTAWESLTAGDFQEYRVGLEFNMPVGFRRELAGVRNAQLEMARELARLEDMELNVSHLLTTAVRDMDALVVVAESHFNQWTAYTSEVQALQEKQRGGESVDTDFILRAYQRAVAAEISFHQTICDYNKAIAQVHFRKGSLLEYSNVCLAEGPWPKKAYWDALGHARRRSASKYVDYGWTQPYVISRGAAAQHVGTSAGFIVVPETVPVPEAIPVPAPQVPPKDTSAKLQPETAPGGEVQPAMIIDAASLPDRVGPVAAPSNPVSRSIGWSTSSPPETSAASWRPNGTAQQVGYEQPPMKPVMVGAPAGTSRPVGQSGSVVTNPLR